MSCDDHVQIERLARRKKGRPGEEIEVLLSDASSFFVSLRVWEERPFHEGDLLSPEELTALKRKSERVAIHSQALSLLARAEHSGFLLHQKLVSRGRDPELTREVLDQLVDQGVLDDLRYARSWLRDRIRRHPEGRSMLLAGLRNRGVSSQIAEQAVDEALSEEETSPTETARRLARRLLRSRGATPDKVALKLMRRGFSRSTVREVIDGLDELDSED